MLIQIKSPATKDVNSSRFALFRLGFRPFYLAAAVFGVLAIAWWWAEFSLGVSRPTQLGGTLWHAHEMVFGFATAVVAGFLLTAAQTWTGVATPSGWRLVMLVMAWLAGRIGLWWYSPITAWVDMLFLPLLAMTLWEVLAKAGNKRNYFLIVLLAVLTTCNAVFHATANGLLALSAIGSVEAALFIMVVLITVIGGRVLPMFTANGIAGVRQYKRAWLERLAVALTAVGLVLFVMGVQQFAPAIVAGTLVLAATANAARLIGWGALKTTRKPILWILHASYAWIPVGLVLLALKALGVVSTSAAIHALALGAVAGMMLGMMTRTSRGHTGLVMQASGTEVTAYACIQLGAFVRVAAALAGHALYEPLLTVAAGLWIVAFSLFVAKFAPALLRPRSDGKPG